MNAPLPAAAALRLLIVSASGFVGPLVAGAAERSGLFTVIRGSRRGATGPSTVAIDLAEPTSIAAALSAARPDVVVLTAAWADIDGCQRDPARAAAVNEIGPGIVARCCAERRARLVFLSTDQVFDGSRPGFAEGDAPCPLSVYGRTKAAAEHAIREALPDAIIVRPSLVLGRACAAGANSYVDKLLASLARGETAPAFTCEFRNPIDAPTLCELVLELAERRELSGTFHAGCRGRLSRYEIAVGVAQQAGYSAAQIAAVDCVPADRAPRALDNILLTPRTEELCRTVLPACDELFRRAVGPPS